MSAKTTTKTCRFCLGAGCLHCGRKGYIVTRLFSRQDVEAAKLRRQIFGTTMNDERRSS